MSGVFFLKLFAALIDFFIYLFISTYFAVLYIFNDRLLPVPVCIHMFCLFMACFVFYESSVSFYFV